MTYRSTEASDCRDAAQETNSLPFGRPCRSCLLLNPFAAAAAVFTVNTTADVVDEHSGGGVCDCVPPRNICTRRAAIAETNLPLAGADQIACLME